MKLPHRRQFLRLGAGAAALSALPHIARAQAYPSTHALNGGFYSLSYDVLNDFAPISPITTGQNVYFARKTVPANDLGELIAWLRANPGKASAGIYSGGSRLVSALFQKETGTQFNIIPYRGGGQHSRTWWLDKLTYI
jgi:tripartite-type tricarboxylate transporter receptor subunit TctC